MTTVAMQQCSLTCPNLGDEGRPQSVRTFQVERFLQLQTARLCVHAAAPVSKVPPMGGTLPSVIWTRWFRYPGECKEVWTSRCLWELNNPSLIITKGKYLLPLSFHLLSIVCLSLSKVSVLKCSI